MAKGKRSGSIRSRVKEFMQNGDETVSVTVVANALGVTAKDAGGALASLVRSGDIVRAGRGMYQRNGITRPTVDDIVKVRDSAQGVRHYEGDSLIVSDSAATSDDEDSQFIDWFSQHLGVDPDRVAVALAYYDMFVAESGTDARVTR